jgi:hypothetical protein
VNIEFISIIYTISEDDELVKPVFLVGNISVRDVFSLGIDYFYPKNATFEDLLKIFKNKRKDIVHRLSENVEISKYESDYIYSIEKEIFDNPEKIIEQYAEINSLNEFFQKGN